MDIDLTLAETLAWEGADEARAALARSEIRNRAAEAARQAEDGSATIYSHDGIVLDWFPVALAIEVELDELLRAGELA